MKLILIPVYVIIIIVVTPIAIIGEGIDYLRRVCAARV